MKTQSNFRRLYEVFSKSRLKKAKSISLFLLLVLVTIFAGMSNNGCMLIAREEIMRSTSPDGKVDFVLVETNGGATTPFIYSVYITPKGSQYKKGHELFTADHLEDFKVKWVQEKLLEISYEQARIFYFSNFWHSDEVDNFSYVVELQLKPLSEGFSLSKRDRKQRKKKILAEESILLI